MTQASDLQHKVSFWLRTATNPDAPDDFGNVVAIWVKQFDERAEITHLRGGEVVLAARLSGRHVQAVRVRSSATSRAVTTDWLLIDDATGQRFDIKDVSPTKDRLWLDFLCESGAAV